MATVMRDEYATCFIDAEDEEMIAHGMGEFAGTYGRAMDLCYMDTMRKVYKRKVDYRTFEVISRGSLQSLDKKGLTCAPTSSIIDT